jgi:protein-S-isoprenylcysteine O-methyltransferase Ste14
MSLEQLQWRRAIVCGSGLLYWAGVAIQARRIRACIGQSPNVRPRGTQEKILWFGWFLVILVWIGQPLLLGMKADLRGLHLMETLTHPLTLVLGCLLVTLGYAATLWAYAAMGNSWRMGVDASERTVLVCSGPFRWVRHPIYVLQAVMLSGAALLLPTPISFAILALHYVCVRFKARNEERHLETIHGSAYREYCSHTGALVPRWLGKRVLSHPQPIASNRNRPAPQENL